VGKVLAITNQKGGVGKTTTCINLAASLVATRRKILLVDLDPQGNATMGSGVDKDSIQFSGYELLMEEMPVATIKVAADPAGYDLVPSNAELTAAEVELLDTDQRESRLRKSLEIVRHQYDFVLIDCPPSLSMLTINALTAANSVIIPVQCEYYALEGLSALLNTIKSVAMISNPGLEVEGLVRTMYDSRNSLSRDVSGQLIDHFGDQVYRTLIPRNVRLAEAPSYGMPVLHYDKQSRGSIAYLSLAGELVRRQERAGS
jgi:chromosome partitioning protein|tara:strand:+ start:65 stop:841 length:777 start_codon:yes stop_codon:yes gene_type:complete